MKVLSICLFFLFQRLNFQEHYCGYYGTAASTIERELDECMQENVKENRVLMSIGFENQDKIAAPLKSKEEEINKALINLSFDICKFESDPNEDQDLSDDQILNRKRFIDECKKYFDTIIQNVFDSENLSSILEEDDEPLVNMVEDQETVDEVKGKIQALIQPISKCKGPQKELETRLKEKYLKDYLEKMTSPQLPSFSWDNVDVLLHPDIYIMKNDDIEVPDFDEQNVNTPSSNMILIPREKVVTMSSMGDELDQRQEDQKDKIESKKFWDRLKFWRSNESIKEDNQELKDMEDDFLIDQDDWNKNHTHETHPLAEQGEDKSDKLYKQKVQIANFWDKDINIKNKRINDEDYDRYKIKGWDLDDKINKLFDIKKLI